MINGLSDFERLNNPGAPLNIEVGDADVLLFVKGNRRIRQDARYYLGGEALLWLLRCRGRDGGERIAPDVGRNLLAIAWTGCRRGEAFAPDVGRNLLAIAWTGCRRGEAFALKWTDYVDGELHIVRAVCRGEEKATKANDPRRLAVVEPLAELLEAQERWLTETKHPGKSSGLMFPANPKHARASAKKRKTDEVHWYRSPSSLDKPLAKIVASANLPEISLHSFRRTYENLLRKAGVDQLVRRSLAGWRSSEAQGIYAGVDRDQAARAVLSLVQGEGINTRTQHPSPKTKTPGGRLSPTSRRFKGF